LAKKNAFAQKYDEIRRLDGMLWLDNEEMSQTLLTNNKQGNLD
jgi:hypothetical protein